MKPQRSDHTDSKDLEALRGRCADLEKELRRLRQMEQRFLLAMEGANIGLWDQDFRTDRIYRSPQWAHMLGFEPEDIDNRMSVWKDIIHPEDKERVDHACDLHERGLTPAFRIEHRMRTADGGWKWIMNWGRIIERDEGGEPVRAVGIHLDVDDRRRAEAELARVDKLESMGLLAGGLAHDFNNALTAVVGNLSMAALSVTGDGETAELLRDAETAAGRASNLTQKLLTFARGGAPLRRRVEFTELLAETTQTWCGEQGHVLPGEILGELTRVDVDQGQIQHALRCLLANAIESGGTLERVSAARFLVGDGEDSILDPGHYICALIDDSGTGVPDDILGRVFDPFFSTRSGQHGLGLAIAESIARHHGGGVALLPRPEGGTRAKFCLPLIAEDIGKGVDGEECCAPDELRLLVMDDEDDVLNILGKMLDRLGHSATLVHEGGRAIEEFREARQAGRPYHVVILDLTVTAGMGGKEAMEKLREIDPDVRAVVSSGYSNDPIMADHADHGFRSALAKPYRIDQLSTTIREVMGCGC